MLVVRMDSLLTLTAMRLRYLIAMVIILTTLVGDLADMAYILTETKVSRKGEAIVILGQQPHLTLVIDIIKVGMVLFLGEAVEVDKDGA